MQYDRELTQRTTIIDDQEDYYNTSTSVWVSDDERLAAIELENKRSEEIHQRNKMTLNIAFD